MPFPRLRVWLPLGAVALGAGCSKITESPTESPTGALQITATTSGPSRDPNGYVLTVNGAGRGKVESDNEIVVTGLAVGDYLVGLGGVANYCQVQGSNPLSVSIEPGDTARVAFALICQPTTSTLLVTTTTSGSGVDPDGYAFAIDGRPAQRIGADSSVTLVGLTPRVHTVQLSDLSANCTVQGTNPVAVTLETTKPAEAVFAITCAGPQVPAAILKVSGDNQTGPQGIELSKALVVQVVDAAGEPIPNVSVVWTIGRGAGSVSPENTPTDAQGFATARWTLGTLGVSSVQAGLSGADIGGNPLAFIASAVSSRGFNITVRFLSSPTPVQLQAFANAAARWEAVIKSDLPDIPLSIPAGGCGEKSPQVNQLVDDLLILVDFVDIAGIYGRGAPCTLRAQSFLPIVGMIDVDNHDLDDPLLSDIILHEIGHVLGFGGLGWDLLGLKSGTGGIDPHFVGAQAISAFNAVGGSIYTSGEKVPLENFGGPGARESHWRESVFGTEVMTGFIGPSVNPLSVVTLAALADMGYEVDLTRADPYSIFSALRVGAPEPVIALGNDQIRGPIRLVDPQGRITRTLEQ